MPNVAGIEKLFEEFIVKRKGLKIFRPTRIRILVSVQVEMLL